MAPNLDQITLEMPKGEPLREGRRLLDWRGISAENIQMTGPGELHYRWLGARNCVCLSDIRTSDGELFQQGVLLPKLLDVRDKISFVPTGCEIHGWSKLARPRNSLTALYYDPQIVARELDRPSALPDHRPMLRFDDAGLRSTLGKLTALLVGDTPIDPLHAETLGLLAALEINRLQTSGVIGHIRDTGRLSAEHERLILLFIDENLHRNVSLAELADIVQLSRFHFTRSFKKTLGLPPHQFILHCRVNRAKNLLLRSEPSISEIAQNLGFGNQGRFASSFRKVTGFTPAYFRRLRR
jgi:AraC family transcriptional regulator